MEHTPPVPPIADLDGDSFQRIWQRVMPEEKPDCPIEPVHSRPPGPEPLPTPELPPEEPTEDSAPSAPTDQLGRDDFPGEENLCLGKRAAGQGLPLQGHILTELEGWQLYRHLARRVSGTNARALTALASEKHGHARRLAAAYFLISGVRYWPTDRLDTPHLGGWLAMNTTRGGKLALMAYLACGCLLNILAGKMRG